MGCSLRPLVDAHSLIKAELADIYCVYGLDNGNGDDTIQSYWKGIKSSLMCSKTYMNVDPGSSLICVWCVLYGAATHSFHLQTIRLLQSEDHPLHIFTTVS
ncbi:hypothetical protein CEXT_223471 [Caerostris extrusa]|uniref:Uncharacterized protein n=1 Tax=Caerostris extrusa TaxID=172846 RepID=A0AAV4XWA0_CAEEX|nr:hypothetical protein CEXT_223471 [Caerostris extrusa]